MSEYLSDAQISPPSLLRQPFPGHSSNSINKVVHQRNLSASPFAGRACERQARACVSFEEAALNELVAQLVEQRPFKAWVVRSSRTELTILFDGSAANSKKTPTRSPPVILVPPMLQAFEKCRQHAAVLRATQTDTIHPEVPGNGSLPLASRHHRSASPLCGGQFLRNLCRHPSARARGFSVGDHLLVRQAISPRTG